MMRHCFDVNAAHRGFDVRVRCPAPEMTELRQGELSRVVEMLAQGRPAPRLFCVFSASFDTLTVDGSLLVVRRVSRGHFWLMGWEAGCCWRKS